MIESKPSKEALCLGYMFFFFLMFFLMIMGVTQGHDPDIRAHDHQQSNVICIELDDSSESK